MAQIFLPNIFQFLQYPLKYLSKLENLGDIIHVKNLNIDIAKFDIISDIEGSIVSVRLPKGTHEEEMIEVSAAAVPSIQEEKKTEKEAKSA